MRLFLIALAALALAAAPADAQTPAAPAPVDLSSVRKDLRNLVTAQEVYFTKNNSYSPDIAALELTLSDSVTIKFVEVFANAYAVSGSIKGKSGASCVLMVGNVSGMPKTEQGNVAKAEGGVLCDGDAEE